MAISRRLTAVLAYKAEFAIPKVLLVTHDMEEAKKLFEASKDKGYARLKVISSFDLSPIHRWQAEPVKA
jgi:hypothetical protein